MDARFVWRRLGSIVVHVTWAHLRQVARRTLSELPHRRVDWIGPTLLFNCSVAPNRIPSKVAGRFSRDALVQNMFGTRMWLKPASVDSAGRTTQHMQSSRRFGGLTLNLYLFIYLLNARYRRSIIRSNHKTRGKSWNAHLYSKSRFPQTPVAMRVQRANWRLCTQAVHCARLSQSFA